MKNTQLEEMTDAELSEAFALEVAGWTKDSDGDWWSAGGFVRDFSGNPMFATSADAVLPWLEKKEVVEVIYNNNPNSCAAGFSVKVSDAFTEDLKEPKGRSGWVMAATFARAACIALIKAKRNAT